MLKSTTKTGDLLKSTKLLWLGGLFWALFGLVAPEAVNSQAAPASSKSSFEATGTYLDTIEERQFQTSFHPTVIVHARRHAQGQWSMSKTRNPDDNVYIERTADGKFNFLAVEYGETFKTEGFVGKRGLYFCRKKSCDYWLTTNDGRNFIVTVLRNGVPGNAGYTAIELQELVDTKSSDAANMVKAWQTVETNPTAQFVSTRKSADAILVNAGAGAVARWEADLRLTQSPAAPPLIGEPSPFAQGTTVLSQNRSTGTPVATAFDRRAGTVTWQVAGMIPLGICGTRYLTATPDGYVLTDPATGRPTIRIQRFRTAADSLAMGTPTRPITAGLIVVSYDTPTAVRVHSC